MSMRALRRLTEHVDQQHREAMRTLPEELGERHMSQHDPEQVATRRSFVRNLGLGGAAVAFGSALVPVAGLVPEALAQTSSGSSAAPALPAADLALVLFAHGLELAAQATYEAVVATNRLDSESQQTARLFSQHHGEHATALEKLIPKADLTSTPNAAVVNLFSRRISPTADQNALLQVAFDLETGVASTYQLAMGTFTDWPPAAAAATIEPIEAQHAVVWGQALDLPIAQWMPAFQTTAGALQPSQYAG